MNYNYNKKIWLKDTEGRTMRTVSFDSEHHPGY